MDPREGVFDVETTFANIVQARKKRPKKFRGPDAPLYSAIYPMFLVTKLFGLSPYDFVGDRLAPSNSSVVFTLIAMALYTYEINVVLVKFSGIKTQRPVILYTDVAKVSGNYFVVMFNLLLTIFTRSKFAEVWNALQNFDEYARQLGYPRSEKKTTIVAWLVVITQTLIWTAINQSGMYVYNEIWSYNVGYLIVYVGSALSVLKFVGVVSFLGQRFQQLKEIAVQNLPPRFGHRATNVSKKTIRDLHGELMSAGEMLNSLYSWSLLLWLGNLTMHGVINIYFIIDWFMLSALNSGLWSLIGCLCLWTMGYMVQLLMLLKACDYTTSQANAMGAVLIDWNVRLLKRSPQDDSMAISWQFLNRRLRFSAAGCFDVRLSLLCSIASAFSTYLVILLQLP